MSSSSTLGTEDQVAAERQAIRVAARPEVGEAIEVLRTKYLADPAAATAEGRAELNIALQQWTMALLLREISMDTARPKLLWTSESTPHNWFGFTWPGGEWGMNNPDNVYRRGVLDGASRYEIRGRFPANEPAQTSLLHTTLEKYEAQTIPPSGSKIAGIDAWRDSSSDASSKASIGFILPHETLGILHGRNLKREPDGGFVITLDASPANGRPNHVQLRPGVQYLSFRDSFSDWSQRPVPFDIQRIDGPPAGPTLDDDAIVRQVVANLPGWVALNSSFKDVLVIGPANALAEPKFQDAGWQLVAPGRFDLSNDEALIITTASAGARYIGRQVTRRWLMTPDAHCHITSLNNTQAVTANNGETTVVISVKDPGVANWLDPAGSNQGFFYFRWQGLPPGVDPASVFKACRVVRLADLRAELPSDTVWVTPDQRKRQITERAKSYDSRLMN